MRCSFSPYEGKEPYIFVSYSHKDGEAVQEILEKLHTAGFRIWYDDGIEWGTDWPISIAEHIEACVVFIAFLSSNSAASDNCKREIYSAVEQKKSIIPVYFEENIELDKGMKLQLSLCQKTYYYQYKDNDKELFYSRLINNNSLQVCRYTAVSAIMPQNDERIISDSIDATTLIDEIASTPNGVNDSTSTVAFSSFWKKLSDRDDPEDDPELSFDSFFKRKPMSEATERTQNISSPPNKHKGNKKREPVKRNSVIRILNSICLWFKDDFADELDYWWTFYILPSLKFVIPTIIVLAAVGFAYYQFRSVTIAGNKYRKFANEVTIQNTDLYQKDIDSIKALVGTKALVISDCRIYADDISAFIKPKQEELSFANCNITSTQYNSLPLEGSSITRLNLSGAAVSDPSNLQKISHQLKSLDISRTSLPASTIEGMNMLEYLSISNMFDLGTSDLLFLGDCSSLIELRAVSCGLSSLSGIETCSSLVTLDASGNEITELLGLENCTKLSVANLSSNKLSDVSALVGSADTLEKLFLGNNNIVELNALESMPNLRVLSIHDNNLSDISSLNMPKLIALDVSNNSRLSKLPMLDRQLQYLFAANCDLTSLGTQKADQIICPMDPSCLTLELDLSNNPLKTIVPGDGRYARLSIAGVEISDSLIDTLNQVTAIRLFIDYSEKLDLSRQWLKARPDGITIYNCPLSEEQQTIMRYKSAYPISFSDKSLLGEDFGMLPDILIGF